MLPKTQAFIHFFDKITLDKTVIVTKYKKNHSRNITFFYSETDIFRSFHDHPVRIIIIIIIMNILFKNTFTNQQL